MSIRHEGLWHYEFIADRTERKWRVGDQDDDPVMSFETEAEARECVESHNRNVHVNYGGPRQ